MVEKPVLLERGETPTVLKLVDIMGVFIAIGVAMGPSIRGFNLCPIILEGA